MLLFVVGLQNDWMIGWLTVLYRWILALWNSWKTVECYLLAMMTTVNAWRSWNCKVFMSHCWSAFLILCFVLLLRGIAHIAHTWQEAFVWILTVFWLPCSSSICCIISSACLFVYPFTMLAPPMKTKRQPH